MPTPGPGSYDPDAQCSMTSILRSNSDKPLPSFRSRTSRFDHSCASPSENSSDSPAGPCAEQQGAIERHASWHGGDPAGQTVPAHGAPRHVEAAPVAGLVVSPRSARGIN